MNEELYYLVDDTGWYRSIIHICGQPWVTKNAQEKDAARYTPAELLQAKAYFKRKKVNVSEVLVTRDGKKGPVGKTWKKYEKQKLSR